MKIGCTYDFRLYSGRGRRKLLAAVKVMRTEGAQLAADLEPVRVGDTAGTGTIRWDTGSDSGPELYVSTRPRFTGYYPTDSADAIERFEELCAKGADFLLFPRTAFWWLALSGIQGLFGKPLSRSCGRKGYQRSLYYFRFARRFS